MTVGTTRQHDLSELRRPSGAFAMLAVDQREALRLMLAEHQVGPVPDAELTEFKLTATRLLSPYASGVLVDRQFAFDAVVTDGAVAPGCGLIAAADHFSPAHGETVGEVTIDREVDPEAVAAQGAVAMKLLVLHRADGDAPGRVGMVEEFVDRCRSAGLVSIVEPVTRKPLDGSPHDRETGILAAARELGGLGADLYKAEVPYAGEGDEDEIRRACATLTETIASPWVVLSSGVHRDVFPRAVELACREGASGFLSGRAVWSGCLEADDLEAALARDAVPRLQRLCDVVDTHVRG